jgi:hypothetical protein
MTKDEAVALFTLAGFTVTKTWALENQYWPNHPNYCDLRTPWWLVRTEIGLIEIGWRKRVISIDWSDTPIKMNIPEADSWVTHDETYTHAHGAAKALEYLTLLKAAAQRPAKAEAGGTFNPEATDPSSANLRPGGAA